MFDIVLMEQGATIMPALEKDPEDMDAPMLFGACTSWARELI